MRTNKKEITFKSIPENINYVEKFIEEICDFYNINNTYFGNITIAVTEAVNNAILHGNKQNPEKFVKLTFQNKPIGLSFLIKDEGNGFDYDCIPNSIDDTNNSKKFSGKGFFLIKSLADEILFHNSGSMIEIIFKISSINNEIAIDRINKLADFSKTNKQLVK